MKFPFQKRPLSQDQKLQKAIRNLPAGGRCLVVFEGERVSPEYTRHPGDVEFVIVRHWRPDDQPIQWPIEAEPGYQRPVNWRELEAAAGRKPGYAEFVYE